MGTWGPGAFDNDDALDLLDTLAEQDAAQRRQALELIFRTAGEHPRTWTMPRSRGGSGCPPPALRTPGSARPAWFSTTSAPYFETGQGDGFREPGFSKERRLEPQITIGLLAGQDGFRS